jgi:hypothetical protein
MGRCNFCTLQLIRERAKREGRRVVIHGRDVLVMPKKTKIPKWDSPEFKAFRDKYFVAWFMELTTSCAC